MISFIYRPITVRSFKPTGRISSFRRLASWSSEVSNSSNQFQIYTSKSTDPYINLSIEHFLFQKSPPGAKVLFLYVNRPCVVIGRNQNPWLEVNLALLGAKRGSIDVLPEPPALGDVDLIRRRSGGGTVFHDEGNVNWSVICDFTEFTRDKHAEMVVRALRSIGIERARVNERHDIVLDQGKKGQDSNPNDTHKTAFTSLELRPLKVSGSAYKMARNRALHHGTALLNSPNLQIIPDYLHSPAKQYISAKGVESVSSPVSNMGIDNSSFINAVRKHFTSAYRVPDHVKEVSVDESALEIPEIRNGHKELSSREWTFMQTPEFTFSTERLQRTSKEPITKPQLTMIVRHGVIKDCQYSAPGLIAENDRASQLLKELIEGRTLHEMHDWASLLQGQIMPSTQAKDIASLVSRLLPSLG